MDSHSTKTALFFARCPPVVSESELRTVFLQYGEVTNIKLYKQCATSRLSKGCGIVEFTTHAAATAAMEALNGKHVFRNSPSAMLVEWARPDLLNKATANGHAAGKQGRVFRKDQSSAYATPGHPLHISTMTMGVPAGPSTQSQLTQLNHPQHQPHSPYAATQVIVGNTNVALAGGGYGVTSYALPATASDTQSWTQVQNPIQPSTVVPMMQGLSIADSLSGGFTQQGPAAGLLPDPPGLFLPAPSQPQVQQQGVPLLSTMPMMQTHSATISNPQQTSSLMAAPMALQATSSLSEGGMMSLLTSQPSGNTIAGGSLFVSPDAPQGTGTDSGQVIGQVAVAVPAASTVADQASSSGAMGHSQLVFTGGTMTTDQGVTPTYNGQVVHTVPVTIQSVAPGAAYLPQAQLGPLQQQQQAPVFNTPNTTGTFEARAAAVLQTLAAAAATQPTSEYEALALNNFIVDIGMTPAEAPAVLGRLEAVMTLTGVQLSTYCNPTKGSAVRVSGSRAKVHYACQLLSMTPA